MLAFALVAAAFAQDGALPIVGGQLVGGDDWPDAAAIYMGNQVECSGVLVAPNVVLTAGHCAQGITKVKVDTNNYRTGGELIDVQQEFVYPNSQQSEDVTVLLLASDATVPPRAIAQGCAQQYIVDGADVTAVGYGSYDRAGYQYDSKLRQVDIAIDDAECTDFSKCNRSVSPGGELIAGGGGHDTCYGDSGGPLYLHTPYGLFLVGLTSRGWTTDCGAGSVYVRADAIVDFIQTKTGVTLEQPVCNDPPDATADPIHTKGTAMGQSAVAATDPEGQPLTYEISTKPAHGTATVSDGGVAQYIADKGFSGTDSFVVTVSDDGTPPLTADVTIDVTVDKGGCGCDSTPGAAPSAAFLLLALALRRRR